MNTRSNTRTRGAIARIIDPDALLRIGKECAAAQYPEEANPDNLAHGPLPQMIFGVDRGKSAAIVNNEGVGHIEEEDGTIYVVFCWGMSYVRVAIPLDALAAAVTDETIDLADGIRTFGDRLDVNHLTWHRQYAGLS